MNPRLLSRRLTSGLLLLAVSIGVALLVAEFILRSVYPYSHLEGYYIWPPHLHRVFQPVAELMPGVSGDSRFIVNGQGVRGDEMSPSNTYRILAIGGSTTECLYLDQAETWPYLLQRNLNESLPGQSVWVGNAGVSGRTTRHHVVAVRHLSFKQAGIDAVIMMPGINDLSIRLSQGDQYDPDYMNRPGAEKEMIDRTFAPSMETLAGEPFYKRTALVGALRPLREMMYSRLQREDTSGRVYALRRQYRQAASEIRDEMPDLTSALAEYSANINTIIDEAKAKPIRLIFLTQPTMWRADLSQRERDLLWFGGVGDFQKQPGMPYYSVEALAEGMSAYNTALIGICGARGIECIDLASTLPKDTTVLYDDAHFNESGAAQVAAAIAGYLLEHPPFK